MEDWTGRTLDGRFELQECIGEGGYGAVFRGIQLSVGRECAVKVLAPRLVDDDETVERFRLEARTTSRLNHPHTVVSYDFGWDEDHSALFLAMELLDGNSVREHVRDNGPFAIDEAARITRHVAGSLQEAHEAGAVHRDVKPGNLMLVARGGTDRFVKVIDFGIAKAIRGEIESRENLTEQGMMLGTPAFMSPEQVRGQEIDETTDQYALAMTYYFMVAGSAPYEGGSALEVASRHMTAELDPLSDHRPDLSVADQLDDVLLRAASEDPEDRFDSVERFGQRVVEAADVELDASTVGWDTQPDGADRADGGTTVERHRQTGEVEAGPSDEETTDDSTVSVPRSAWDRAPETRSATARRADASESETLQSDEAVRTVFTGALWSVGLVGLFAVTVLGAYFAVDGDGEGGRTNTSASGGDAAAAPLRRNSDARVRGGGAPGDTVGASGDAEGTDVPGARGRDATDHRSRNVGAAGGRSPSSIGGRRPDADPTSGAPEAGKGVEATGRSGSGAGAEGKQGRIVVRLIPWGVLYVDGTRIGRGGRVETQLSPGFHDLMMQRKGEKVVEKRVRVAAGKTLRVELAAP